ncbi:hypothetical protein MSAN_00567800 [Mycena sanguinolenta]|uniref:Uncharacterized protein n=1 Tax=Mycena sanguinolenta TaxID=230812 RepID=A0A8H6Z9R8_9AGAR|nr:hypothetical protein MSAN_00567800 [Mycena sanguinolenta]
MANSLPDEIISEILSPALSVSDAAFSALSNSYRRSPFMTFSESTSAYLLVSKAWLRVSTPLLYHDVILRSKAQAQALATTLTTNPALGRNITDLFLSTTIASSDNASGLCRGLPLLNPVRVIIDTGYRWISVGKSGLKLLETLEQCILTWKKMVSPSVLFSFIHSCLCVQTVLKVPSDFRSDLAKAVAQAPSLQTLMVWHEGSLCEVPPCVRIIAANPSLKRFRIEPPRLLRDSFENDFYTEMKQDKRLMALWDSTDESGHIPADDAASSSLFVYPARLAADPVQEDAIWSRVLYFALERDKSSRRSGKFAQLGVPYLFTNAVVPCCLMGRFGSQLESMPELGSRVQSLTLTISPNDNMTFKKIITYTTALTKLHGGLFCRSITWKAFSDLQESTGASLRSFQGIPVFKPSGPVDSNVFALFPQMQHFGWDSGTVFKTGPKSIPADFFRCYRTWSMFYILDSEYGFVIFTRLPSLRIVTFAATAVGGAEFFQKHGAKLQKLTLSSLQLEDPALAIWRHCISLTVLGVSCDDKHHPTASCLKTSDISAHLERIVFRVAHYHRFKQKHEIALGQLLLSLKSTASFPALREIEHPCCQWPTAEPAISKSQWVKWAESLHERDIHLVDPAGADMETSFFDEASINGSDGSRPRSCIPRARLDLGRVLLHRFRVLRRRRLAPRFLRTVLAEARDRAVLALLDVLQTYRGLPLLDKLAPGDETTRFVIWGELIPEGLDRDLDEVSQGSRSQTDGSSSAPSSSISKKPSVKSSKKGKAAAVPEAPPMLKLSSMEEGGGKKVLVAATIERWIA